MKCLKCPAWGIDNLGFHGCLIKNTIHGECRENYHCKQSKNSILKVVEDVKQNESRSKLYKWKE